MADGVGGDEVEGDDLFFFNAELDGFEVAFGEVGFGGEAENVAPGESMDGDEGVFSGTGFEGDGFAAGEDVGFGDLVHMVNEL